MNRLLLVLLGVLRSTCRSRADLVVENAALRSMIQARTCPCVTAQRSPNLGRRPGVGAAVPLRGFRKCTSNHERRGLENQGVYVRLVSCPAR
jgi:hypothetical protein